MIALFLDTTHYVIYGHYRCVYWHNEVRRQLFFFMCSTYEVTFVYGIKHFLCDLALLV